MSLLGFKRFLVPMITRGEPWWKLGTNRALRKNPIQKGDILHFYTGLRTKSCEYLGVTLCSCQYKFMMHLSQKKPRISHYGHQNLPPYWNDYCRSKPNPYRWPRRMLAELAITDGFNSTEEMWEWFRKAHGERDQFFQRIEWKIPPIPLNRELSTAQQKILLLQLNGLMRPLDVDLFMKHLRHEIKTKSPSFEDWFEKDTLDPWRGDL